MSDPAIISRDGLGDRTRVFAGDDEQIIQCGQSLATSADTTRNVATCRVAIYLIFVF
jgi:hypothetical protein